MSKINSTVLDAALNYARDGRRVLPLHYPTTVGRCSCNNSSCDSVGKHPMSRLVPHGVKDASSDPDTIQTWWTKEPNANIGVVVGEGRAIVDIDGRPAAVWMREHNEDFPVPPTRTTRSGRSEGGWHLEYVTHPMQLKSITDLFRGHPRGVDIKGPGSYTVAPPSRHQSGNRYQLVRDVKPASAPAWLLEAETKQSDNEPGRNGHRGPLDTASIFNGIATGQRDDTLFRLACKFRRADVPEVLAERLTLDAAAACYDPRTRAPDPFPEAEAREIVRRVYATYDPGSADRNSRGTTATVDTDVSSSAHTGRVVTMATVVPELVEWLWPGRIPRGKKVMLDGDPGTGKSTLTLDLAARLSTGLEMPDGTRGDVDGPVNILLLSAEDGLADTIRPRLEAAGADLDRVHVLAGVPEKDGERLPTLADVGLIHDTITRYDIGLVIVDPLMAFMDGDTNTYRDQDVRRRLAPLTQVCEQTGATLLFVRHLTKGNGTNALYRGGGSIGIVGDARAAMLAARDPDDPDRRILAITKSNLAVEPPALAYRVGDAGNGVARIQWEGVTEHTASQLLATPMEPEEAAARSEAKEFLLDTLAGGAVEATEVKRRARATGISETTLHRAKHDLHIRSTKEGYQGIWSWSLPSKMVTDTKDDHAQKADHLWGSVTTFGQSAPAVMPNGENGAAHIGNVGVERSPKMAIDFKDGHTSQGDRLWDSMTTFDAPSGNDAATLVSGCEVCGASVSGYGLCARHLRERVQELRATAARGAAGDVADEEV